MSKSTYKENEPIQFTFRAKCYPKSSKAWIGLFTRSGLADGRNNKINASINVNKWINAGMGRYLDGDTTGSLSFQNPGVYEREDRRYKGAYYIGMYYVPIIKDKNGRNSSADYFVRHVYAD